jgi:DNA-binding GntR family transcriptional regulator
MSIIAGELTPGEIYSTTVLAARFNVSPTPVREAMLDLQGAGLVEALRNRGFRVRIPDDRDLDEILELRRMLEVPVVRGLCSAITREQLATLQHHVDEMRRAANGRDVLEFDRADRAFHHAMLALHGNARIARIVDELRDQTRLLGLGDGGGLDNEVEQHAAILEAIRSGDAQAGDAAVSAHLEHARALWGGKRSSLAEAS